MWDLPAISTIGKHKAWSQAAAKISPVVGSIKSSLSTLSNNQNLYVFKCEFHGAKSLRGTGYLKIKYILVKNNNISLLQTIIS